MKAKTKSLQVSITHAGGPGRGLRGSAELNKSAFKVKGVKAKKFTVRENKKRKGVKGVRVGKGGGKGVGRLPCMPKSLKLKIQPKTTKPGRKAFRQLKFELYHKCKQPLAVKENWVGRARARRLRRRGSHNNSRTGSKSKSRLKSGSKSKIRYKSTKSKCLKYQVIKNHLKSAKNPQNAQTAAIRKIKNKTGLPIFGGKRRLSRG